MTLSKTSYGSLLVLLSALCFGSYSVFARYLGASFEPFSVGYTRAFIISLLLLIPIIYYKQWKKVDREDYKALSILVIFSLFTQVPFYYAFNMIGAGLTSTLFFGAYVLISFLIGYLFLGEKSTYIHYTAALLALIGIVLASGLGSVFSVLGIGLALMAGIASGAQFSFTKLVSDKYSPLQISFIVWVSIFITNLPLSILLSETQHIPTISLEWGAMVLYSLAGLIGVWAVIEGYKYINVSIGSLIGLLEIVFAVALGVLFFQEQTPLTLILGCVCILLSAALPSLYDLYYATKSLDKI